MWYFLPGVYLTIHSFFIQCGHELTSCLIRPLKVCGMNDLMWAFRMYTCHCTGEIAPCHNLSTCGTEELLHSTSVAVVVIV